MELRRKITYEIQGSPLKQKAVALAIFIKSRLDQSSTIRDFSVNKLHTITGLAATTIQKYLPIMKQMMLVSFQGKDNSVLVFHSLHSKTKHRNITIDKVKQNSFKRTYKSLRSFIFLFIQAKKDAIKRLFQSISNPMSTKELKAAIRACKHLAKLNIIKDNEYKEYGLSLKKIASVIGCCTRTAKKVVDYAIKNNWVTKYNHFEKIEMPNVSYMDIDGCSFTTLNYGYIVYANTYELSDAVTNDLKSVW